MFLNGELFAKGVMKSYPRSVSRTTVVLDHSKRVDQFAGSVTVGCRTSTRVFGLSTQALSLKIRRYVSRTVTVARFWMYRDIDERTVKHRELELDKGESLLAVFVTGGR